MPLTQEQIKGRIKSLAVKNNADARLLMRIYMMDRFLERLSLSQYKDNFILKGGILVTSMVGVAMRSTMDIDTTIKNLNLSEEDILKVVKEIVLVQVDDGISFEIKRLSNIMDDFEYPGIRIEMNAVMGKMITPIKIDVSTGDVITPREIEYNYNLMLESRSIDLWAYNLETILAEKLQTILARDVFNTRMRDFYDVYALQSSYNNQIDNRVLKQAFNATSEERKNRVNLENFDLQIKNIAENNEMIKQWEQYQKKYSYAFAISYADVIESVKALVSRIK